MTATITQMNSGSISYFEYGCNDGHCDSDLTANGRHIRWVLRLSEGKPKTFNFRADLDAYVLENKIQLEGMIECQQPT